MIDREEIDALLPLPAATFHILMALADQDRHGYAIIQDVAPRTGGELEAQRGHSVSIDSAHARTGPARRDRASVRIRTKTTSAAAITGSRRSARR